MAHCGFYVPAKKADIKIVDAIFARVWSGDALSKNQSTFMTEMIEVANIINNASDRSFIVFDELGRGTATFDWLALTKAIIQHIAINVKAQTLLATHYHELIQLEGKLPGIKNFSVAVHETETEVLFLKKVIAWGANKSYWIEVAKLAWLPKEITQLASSYLDDLESEQTASAKKPASLFSLQEVTQKTDPQREKTQTLLQSYNINEITPIEALQILEKIINEIQKK